MIKPVAGVEVGLVNGTLTVNPTKQEMENSTLKLTLAGTATSPYKLNIQIREIIFNCRPAINSYIGNFT